MYSHPSEHHKNRSSVVLILISLVLGLEVSGLFCQCLGCLCITLTEYPRKLNYKQKRFIWLAVQGWKTHSLGPQIGVLDGSDMKQMIECMLSS